MPQSKQQKRSNALNLYKQAVRKHEGAIKELRDTLAQTRDSFIEDSLTERIDIRITHIANLTRLIETTEAAIKGGY